MSEGIVFGVYIVIVVCTDVRSGLHLDWTVGIKVTRSTRIVVHLIPVTVDGPMFNTPHQLWLYESTTDVHLPLCWITRFMALDIS